VRLAAGGRHAEVQRTVREHRLATVCEESMCPNIGECWNAGTATIMLMGEVCTRACRFCAVDTGNPRGWLDAGRARERRAHRGADAARYVVLTSVDRDDLPDGGAAHFAACVRAIKARTPATAVEALTPDFCGVLRDVETVVGVRPRGVRAERRDRAAPDAGRARSARRLRPDARGARACAEAPSPRVLTKTSLMLGLGETDAEVAQTMDDLRASGVDLLTLGQYLRPTVEPPAGGALRARRTNSPHTAPGTRAKGFREVVSGPLVRSSYRAERALEGNNVGLPTG
jgi:lipoic acid synthetase